MRINKERVVEKISPTLGQYGVPRFRIEVTEFFGDDEAPDTIQAKLFLDPGFVLPQSCLSQIRYATPEIDSWIICEETAIKMSESNPETTTSEGCQGIKFDKEKTRLDLLSSSWIDGVGQVLTFGAKKYDAHNWRKGLPLSRLLGAALRHTFAFLKGEDLDPETGLSHLYHASCCLMFASELYETRRKDVDDRFKTGGQS